MPSRRCGALVFAAALAATLLAHEVLLHQHLHAAALLDGPAATPLWPVGGDGGGGGGGSNASLSEFDAVVAYSTQIFARVPKGLSLVSAARALPTREPETGSGAHAFAACVRVRVRCNRAVVGEILSWSPRGAAPSSC
jgi:hypothetical protein